MKKFRKLGLILLIIFIGAIIAIEINFLYFPTIISLSADIRCFAYCYDYDHALNDEEYKSLDYIDTFYDISVTKHWNYVSDITGYIIIDDEKCEITGWQESGENYQCDIKREDCIIDDGVVFNKDFSALMIRYNEVISDDSMKVIWFGPAESADELIEVMTCFNY